MRVVRIWLCILWVTPLWLSGCGSSFAAIAVSDAAAPDTLPTHRLPAQHPAPSPSPTRTPTPTARATTPRPLPSPTPRPPHPQPTVADHEPDQPPLTLNERHTMFRDVWQTINQHYIYADFDGLDWHAIWSEYLPRITAARSDQEFYDLMGAMVQRLDDQHSRFLPPDAAVAETILRSGHAEQVGIGVITRPASDGVMIQQVIEGSPAQQAGLQRRDRIVAIDGIPMIAGGEINGQAGTPVRLTVVRSKGTAQGTEQREVVLIRQPVQGRITPYAQRLPHDVGYLSIPTLWINDMHEQVTGVLNDLVVERPLRGLVLDLRGNPGGWRDVLHGVLGHFVQGNAGFFFDRNGIRAMTIRELRRPDLRDVPLVVLVDRETASYAEVLAAILQAEADAYVIGVPTAGNTETIYAYELQHGTRLWIAQEGFRLRNGTELEGVGVQPDELLDVDWTLYDDMNDPQMLAALRHLGVALDDD